MVVRERTLRQGTWATLEYRLATSRPESGAGVIVRFAGLRFLELGGKDARSPELRDKLKPMLGLAKAIPDLHVAPDGRIMGVVHLDRTLREVAAFFEAMNKDDPKGAAEIKAVLESPEFRRVAAEKARELWSAWVGMWVDQGRAPGAETLQSEEVEIMGGVRVKAPAVVRTVGPAKKPKGYLELRYTMDLDGEAAKRGMQRAVSKMMGGSQVHVVLDGIEKVEQHTRVTAVVDPATLKPFSIKSERRLRVFRKGKEPEERLERKETTFDWSPGAWEKKKPKP